MQITLVIVFCNFFGIFSILWETSRIWIWDGSNTCLIPEGNSKDGKEDKEDLPGNIWHKDDDTEQLN